MHVKALFIGGNGIISADCSRLAVERGWELTLLNRGIDGTRPPLAGVESIVGDATDPGSVRTAVGSRTFDVVVNFRAFTPEQVQADVEKQLQRYADVGVTDLWPAVFPAGDARTHRFLAGL